MVPRGKVAPLKSRALHTASFYLLIIHSEKDARKKGGNSALKEKKTPRIFCSPM